MHREHFLDLIKFAASSALACVMSLAAGPAMAQVDLTLTPYRIVSSTDGRCMTVGTVDYPNWGINALPCSASNYRQVFYVLNAGRDKDYLLETNLQPGRIALADTFDDATEMEYNLLSLYPNSPAYAFVTGSNSPNESSLQTFYISPVPKISTWTPVANQNQTFGIAGERTFRYGPGTNGQYATRTVRGIDVNGSGQCTDSFFPNYPPGTQKICAVEGKADRYTPLHMQIKSTQTGACLRRVAHGGLSLYIEMGSCTPTSDNVWMLEPTKYEGQ